MSTLNPYAPPQASSSATAIERRGHWLKWLYAAIASFTPLLVLASRADLISPDVFRSLAGITPGVVYLKGSVGLWWLYGAWQSVPLGERKLSDGNPVTPGAAVGKMFIPVFGLYWMFMANTSLCAAINRVLASLQRVQSADATPSQLAAAGQIALVALMMASPVLGVVGGAIVSGFWFWHMLGTDAARARMEGALAAS